MERTNILQKLINKNQGKVYLEIGLRNGKNFLKIRAKKKIGIDPYYKLSKSTVLKYYIAIPANFSNKYFATTSDSFFENNAEFLSRNKIDVAFIDGFHEYEQSLKDVNNVLKHLSEKGVIVLHDCSPATKEAAIPYNTFENFRQYKKEGGWNGDVWKTIVDLRSNHKDLSIFVLNCDHGLGIVTRGNNTLLPFTKDEIKKMDYHYLDNNREYLLNLKEPEYLDKFIDTL